LRRATLSANTPIKLMVAYGTCSLSSERWKLNMSVYVVKGSNKEGYAWDGCSPKIKIKDVYFGTPEAVLNFETGNSKTYYASLIHDVFYQFSTDLKSFISRKEVDREFYIILKENKFRFAKLYYGVVRLLGWLFW
jgi:hypothetical protein